MSKRLEDLDVLEVSLVKKPANLRKLLLLKSMGGIEMENTLTEEVLKSILEAELENEEKINEVLKQENLSDEAKNAVRGALRILQAFREELPNGILNQMGNLLENGGVDMSKKGDVKKEDLEKMDIPKEIKDQLQKLWKENDEYIKKATELADVLKAEQDDRMKKEFIQKAEEFKALSIKPEDFGLVLKELNEKAPEQYVVIEQLLKAMDEQLSQSELFKEKGSGVANDVGNAWGKIEKISESLMKEDKLLSSAQAITKALENNPTLYNEWLKEGGK